MRTTLNLDDDVVRAARALADAEGRSLGQVVSDLARKGLSPERGIALRNGFPVFDVRPETPIITPDLVRRLMDEL